jgi:hypothetical protein
MDIPYRVDIVHGYRLGDRYTFPLQLSSERPQLSSERPQLSSERPQLSSERPQLSSERPRQLRC